SAILIPAPVEKQQHCRILCGFFRLGNQKSQETCMDLGFDRRKRSKNRRLDCGASLCGAGLALSEAERALAHERQLLPRRPLLSRSAFGERTAAPNQPRTSDLG